MVESFYQRTAKAKFPKATVSGDGPHGVFIRARLEVILHKEFSDARTLADVSGGRLVFLPRPVGSFNNAFGYREQASA